MKVGSLVECIVAQHGYLCVGGEFVKMCPTIAKKERLTVRDIFTSIYGSAAMTFEEKTEIIHPNLGLKCGYPIEDFRELLPPEEIEEALEEVKEHLEQLELV